MSTAFSARGGARVRPRTTVPTAHFAGVAGESHAGLGNSLKPFLMAMTMLVTMDDTILAGWTSVEAIKCLFLRAIHL